MTSGRSFVELRFQYLPVPAPIEEQPPMRFSCRKSEECVSVSGRPISPRRKVSTQAGGHWPNKSPSLTVDLPYGEPVRGPVAYEPVDLRDLPPGHALLPYARELRAEPSQQRAPEHLDAEVARLVDVAAPLLQPLEVVLRPHAALAVGREVVELHGVELLGDLGQGLRREAVLLDEVVERVLAAEEGLLALVVDPVLVLPGAVVRHG